MADLGLVKGGFKKKLHKSRRKFFKKIFNRIINPRHACTGGLQYLSCVSVCVCVSVLLPLYWQHPSFLHWNYLKVTINNEHLILQFC